MVKNLPAKQKSQVQSLGQEDPLEESMQLIPAFLPGEFHRQRSLAGSSPRGRKEPGMTERLILFTFQFISIKALLQNTDRGVVLNSAGYSESLETHVY